MQIIKKIFSIREIPILHWSSAQPINLRPQFLTFIYLILGLFLFGLGETILIASSQGVSPWTVLAQGISFKSNLSIGTTTFFVSIGVLILWIPLKQKPGLGTIMNVIIISIVLDYSYDYLPKPSVFVYQIIQIIIGVLIVGIGSGFYLIANLGPGPRDGLMTGIQRKTNLPIAVVRAFLEITVVSIGWYLGGTVGIGTLLFAFGIGPAVALGLLLVAKTFS